MDGKIGFDIHALQTNLLANAIILLSGTLTLWICLIRLIVRGSIPFRYPDRYDWIIVPGHALEIDQPSADFRARLDRAADLARRVPDARILILGGVVPGQTHSEATVGREHLRASRITQDRIHLEQTSRNTLENFQCAVPMLRENCERGLVLVTNRYHLARSETLACNLGLRPMLCPAEVRWRPGLYELWRIVWEAYLLHWYHVGRIYAVLTDNKAMLTRITHRENLD